MFRVSGFGFRVGRVISRLGAFLSHPLASISLTRTLSRSLSLGRKIVSLARERESLARVREREKPAVVWG